MSVESQIRNLASIYGVPPDLAVAVARRESGLRHNVIGPAGEIGIMQLMPATAAELGIDPYDLTQNIIGGLSYLRKQYDRFGSWELALAAYNAGPGRVASGNIPQSTWRYVESIIGSQPKQEQPPPGAEPIVQPEPETFPLWVLGLLAALVLWNLVED